MPRPRKPHWHDRDRCYYTRIDGKQVPLKHADGTKVAHGDAKGIREAVDRLLRKQEAAVERMANPTVQDLCSDYLKAKAKENTAETMVGKEWILTKFCEFTDRPQDPPYGQRPAKDLDARHLFRMRKVWQKEGYAGATLRRLYSEVQACWAWAYRPDPEREPMRILDKNEFAGLKLPAQSPPKSRYVPLATVQALIKFAEQRAAALPPIKAHFERQAVLMLRLLTETGARPKEVCQVRWTEFNEADETIILAPDRHKTGRKTGKVRIIIIPPALVKEIVALRESGRAHPVNMFAHKRSRGIESIGAGVETGAPWRRPGYTAWFCRLVRAANHAWKDDETKPKIPVGITLYWLRHAYLTDAQLEAGGERAADLAGNTKEIARGTYLHVSVNELKAVSQRVAARRNAALDQSRPDSGNVA